MNEQKYPYIEEEQDGMAAESLRGSQPYSYDYDDIAVDESEDCVGDWNEEMDELAKLAIKVGIDQILKGEGCTLEDLLKDRDEIFGRS